MTWVLTPIEETKASAERAVSAEAVAGIASRPATAKGRTRMGRICPSRIGPAGRLPQQDRKLVHLSVVALERRSGREAVGSLDRMPRPVSGTNGTGNGTVSSHDPFSGHGTPDAHPGGLVGALRRHWFLIVFTAMVATTAGYAISQVQDQSYTASALVLVDPTSPEATALGADSAQDS